MRVPNPRLQRLAGLSKGAIIEPGDGELLIPAVLQPCITLVSPLSNNRGIGAQLDDSGALQTGTSINGVVAAFTNQICSVNQGLWEINWFCQAGFRGTSNAANAIELLMTDPASVSESLWSMGLLANSNSEDSGKFTVLLQSAPGGNWSFSWNLKAATVAGDLLTSNVMLMLNRIS
jgi:hypothetical protein